VKDLRKDHEMCPGVSQCAGCFGDSPGGPMITFHSRKHSFDAAELKSVRRNENQLYSDRIPKSSNARRIVKCHVDQ